MIDIVKKAAENVGGVVALAKGLGVKHPSLHSWRRVPAERVRDLEKLSGIPCHEIRPDLYSPPVEVA